MKHTSSSLKVKQSLIDFKVVRFIDIEHKGEKQKYCPVLFELKIASNNFCK